MTKIGLIAPGSAQPSGENMECPVTTVNHLSYPSLDYRTSRDFYVDLLGLRAVWDDGTKCQVDCGPDSAPNSVYLTSGKADTVPTVAHFSFGLPNYWAVAEQLRSELARRGFQGVKPDGQAGWFVNGPSGFVQHIVVVKDPAMFPGAARPCAEANSAECRQAYESGLKNLDSIPKASGRGFEALYFNYIILHVPDVDKERDFYTSLMGMKVVSDTKVEVSLRFGENTLVLRPAGADGKPYCNEFGFVISNYDPARVKAELDRRGINSKPGAFGGVVFSDPNGLEIGIAGRS
jgi:catechol 2,3-dioxygenase-like lactoylglutathione lyase family enzyme